METLKLPWVSLGHVLEHAATECPDAPLLIYEGDRLTYAEVDRRVNQIANLFRALGLSHGDRVSVMLPNGFDFPTIWLAIAKTGLIMVPTNIQYQMHDLEYILSDSKASCMILHADFVPQLEKVKERVPTLKQILVVGGAPAGYESFEEQWTSQADGYTIRGVTDKDPINIQYTSGTTGFPKGCILPHRYWMVVGRLKSQSFGFRPTDVNFNAQPFYYMDPQTHLATCLMAGMSLVLVPRFSVSGFWRTIVENDVSFFYCLGTMPLMLLNREPDELEKQHRLRFVSCSGIPKDLHETIEKRFGCPWREIYGSTESGTDLFVPLEDSQSVGTGSLGRPVSTKEAKILDEEGNGIPDGEVGELALRGEPMMLGYWGKPEATAEKLRDGWLHTGDLFYKDEEGRFHIVGRSKDMIRRAGENISASEVEGVLAQHPKVKVSAVLPVPDRIRGEEPKAYVVLTDGETVNSLSPQELIEFAKIRLAAFKIPRYVEYVESLPMTPSERVAKNRLIEAKDDLRRDSYDAAKGAWVSDTELETDSPKS